MTDAAAVIVGADAVASAFWINKVGTHGLAAAAYRQGVPVYVVAGRAKGMPAAVARRWRQSSGPPAEVWPEADSRVRLDNPYFEATPVELATLFLTDAGAVPAEGAGDAGQPGDRSRSNDSSQSSTNAGGETNRRLLSSNSE